MQGNLPRCTVQKETPSFLSASSQTGDFKGGYPLNLLKIFDPTFYKKLVGSRSNALCGVWDADPTLFLCSARRDIQEF